jgi:heavy metal sensor kinase
MKSLSVRWRLTLWYGTILTCAVTLFGAMVLFLNSRNVLRRIDTELQEEAEELALEVQLAASLASLQQQLRDRFYDHEHFEFQVASPRTGIVFKSQRLENVDLPATGPTEPGEPIFESRQVGPFGDSRVVGQLVLGPSGRFVVQALMPLAPSQRESGELATILLATGPLSVVLALAGGYWLARRALSPVERMAAAAEQISMAHLDRLIEVGNPDDELGRLGRALNGMIARLRDAVRQMQQFTADAAHELRTPLAVLQTESEVALRTDRTVDDYRKVVECTLHESRRLARLAGQLLQLSQCDARSFEIVHEEVPLDAVVADVAEQLQAQAARQGISLDVAALDECSVAGDDIQLSQVFFNLLDNAVKYTSRGGQVRVSSSRDEGQVTISVTNTGPGIAAEHLPHIFDRFYRIDRSRTEATGGAGLGLAICKAIVEAHGGTIAATSAVGDSTKFSVTFALLKVPPRHQPPVDSGHDSSDSSIVLGAVAGKSMGNTAG